MPIRPRVVAAVVAPILVLPAVLGAASAAASSGQSVTDLGSAGLDDLVATLVGPGVQTSNVTFTGSDRAVGRFSGMDALGLASGIALSTGSVADDLPGPHGARWSTEHFTPGDADIDELVGLAGSSRDAAVLEFDFVPRADSLTIDYVFGSMEYLEFVGQKYIDAFGFFVNGTNCATVDGQPVTISTINDRANAALYVDNAQGEHATGLNGFTKRLTCRADVQPGRLNHVKLAIADVGDHRLDSAVLIGAGGFFSNTAPMAADLDFTMDAGATAEIVYPGSDPDGDALTYTVTSGPAHGSLRPIPGGAAYTADAEFVGVDTFGYTVDDGIDVAGPYTVTITTRAPTPGPSPEISDVTYSAVQGQDLPITLVAHLPDAGDAAGDNDDAVTFDIVAPPQHGSLRGDGAARVYRSADDFTGTDAFRYTAARGSAVSQDATITIAVGKRPLPAHDTRPVAIGAPGPVAAPTERTLASTGTDASTAAVAAGVAAAALLAAVAGAGALAVQRRRESGSRG